MKYLKYFLPVLILFAACTSNQPSTTTTNITEAVLSDSNTASKMAVFTAAAPAGTTTTVTKINQPNKDTMWVIVTGDSTCYQQPIFQNHPFGVTPPPPPPPPANNQSPRAKAGADFSIAVGATAILNGSGSSDPDGTIATYKWTQETGTQGVFSSSNAVTNVTGLKAGGYRFRLTVADNFGATGTDTVHVSVTGSTTPPPPPPPPPPPTGGLGTLIYSSGYDNVNDLDPFQNGQFGCGTLASHLSTTVFKTGPGSFHSVPCNVSSGIRSEVQYGSAQTPLEGSYEWDVMYVKVQQDAIHSFQFHPSTSGGSAAPGLWHEGGKFEWVNWKGGTNTKYTTGVTIQANHWYHMIFQYKFGSSGYMKFTVDGVVVLDKTNIQVGDGSSPYVKVGTNSWSGTNSEAYYDNLKIYKK